MNILMTDNKSVLGTALYNRLIDDGHDITVYDVDLNQPDDVFKQEIDFEKIELCLNNKYQPSDSDKPHGQLRLNAIFLDLWADSVLKYIINIADKCAVDSHVYWEGSKEYRAEQVKWNAIERKKSGEGSYPNHCVMYIDYDDDKASVYADVVSHMVKTCSNVWVSKIVLGSKR